MTNKSRSAYIAFAACCLSLAVAQDSIVECNYAKWATNSRGECPCLVWAELQTKCDLGGIRVTPLNGPVHYSEPDEPHEINDCNCSVVSYNLMAACTLCQLGIQNKWVNETVWRSNCPTYNARGLSVDVSDLAIPSWAMIPADGGMWRPSVASLAASQPTANPTSGSSTSASAPQSTASQASGRSQAKDSKGGAIAGGVVGAALIVILFAALFTFIRRRGKRRAAIKARMLAPKPSRSSHSRTRSRNEEEWRSKPGPTVEAPARPEMAYHPRCNHGLFAITATSPRASTSTNTPIAIDHQTRPRPKSGEDVV